MVTAHWLSVSPRWTPAVKGGDATNAASISPVWKRWLLIPPQALGNPDNIWSHPSTLAVKRDVNERAHWRSDERDRRTARRGKIITSSERWPMPMRHWQRCDASSPQITRRIAPTRTARSPRNGWRAVF